MLRIAAWQAAFVLAFAATGQATTPAATLGTLAALTLILSAARVRGEWLSTLVLRQIRFVARTRTRDDVLPRDTTITSAGVLVSADGMTIVVRTPACAFPALDADLQLIAHRGPRQARPTAWLAITVRRDADHATDEQLRVPLDNLIRRVRKEFALLTGREVEAAIGELAPAGPVRESWRHWRSGSVTQIAFRLDGADPADVEQLTTPDDAAITVALRPDGTGIVRVAAPTTEAAERAARHLRAITHLERLDGRHGPAVLASLPIGGTLS